MKNVEFINCSMHAMSYYDGPINLAGGGAPMVFLAPHCHAVDTGLSLKG